MYQLGLHRFISNWISKRFSYENRVTAQEIVTRFVAFSSS